MHSMWAKLPCMLAEPRLMYLSNYSIYITPFDYRLTIKVFRFIVLHESLTCIKTMYGKHVQLSMLLLFVHLVHLNSLSITIFFLTCLIFPKRKAQSEYDYWIPDMSISQCKSWLCWHDNAIASLRQRVLRLVPSWGMELNIRMKCYERTFSLIDSITKHHCSPVDYWACSIKNGHSLWSLNDI